MEIILDHLNAIILRDIIFGLYRPNTLFFNFQNFQEFMDRRINGIVNFMMLFIHSIMNLLIHIYERARYLESISQSIELSDVLIRQLADTFLYNEGWLQAGFNMPTRYPELTIRMPHFETQITNPSTINLFLSTGEHGRCIFRIMNYDYSIYLILLIIMCNCIEYELLLPSIIPYLITENILNIFAEIHDLIGDLIDIFDTREGEDNIESMQDILDQIVSKFVTGDMRFFLVDRFRTRLLAIAPGVNIPIDLMEDVRNYLLTHRYDGGTITLLASLIDIYRDFYQVDQASYNSQIVIRYAMQIYLIMMNLYTHRQG